MLRPAAISGLPQQLRLRQTDAERVLWTFLRSRQLAGFKFRRQHPVGPYVLDFYCPAARLAVEVDGEQHATPEQERHDDVRTHFLTELGIRVIRFSNQEVITQRTAVLETLLNALVESQS